MRQLELLITCKSDLCAANGSGVSGLVHCRTALENGIPYIPARRIKGCLLNAGKEMADNGYLPGNNILEELFGGAGGKEGALRVEDAHLYRVPGYVLPSADGGGDIEIEDYDAFRTELQKAAEVLEEEAEAVFTAKRMMTAMDQESGSAADGTLRSMQVVPAGMVFKARLWLDAGEKEDECRKLLSLCCKGMRHIGMSISRGLGEVVCSIEEAADTRCSAGVTGKPEEKAFIPSPEEGREHGQRVEKAYENIISRLKRSEPEEEVSVFYNIYLKMPVVLSGGMDFQEDSPDQIPGSVLQGALAGMYIRDYIRKKELADKAHENEQFRRIFLRDGVSFGCGFLKKGGRVFLPCPASLARVKYQDFWVNRLCAGQEQERVSGIRSQVFMEKCERSTLTKTSPEQDCAQGNKSEQIMYTADVKKEVRMHHARPADRGIGHSLNDRASGPAADYGILFQYTALSAGQAFEGCIKGRSKDVLSLLECLARRNGHLMLGRSKNAEYGTCLLEPFMSDYTADKAVERTKKGKKWLIWFLSPAVFSGSPEAAFTDELYARLKLRAKPGRRLIRYITIGGYNSKWSLPSLSAQAVAPGSALELDMEEEAQASQIENIRWGEWTGKGCGQVKAVCCDEWKEGKHTIRPVEEEISEADQKSSLIYRSLVAFNEFKRKREQDRKQAVELLQKNPQDIPDNHTLISWMENMVKAGLDKADTDKTLFDTVSERLAQISDEDKRKTAADFFAKCKGKSGSFMLMYLKYAEWSIRGRRSGHGKG